MRKLGPASWTSEKLERDNDHKRPSINIDMMFINIYWATGEAGMSAVYTLAGFLIGFWFAKRSLNKSKQAGRGGAIRAVAAFLWSALVTWFVLFGFFSTPEMKAQSEAHRQKRQQAYAAAQTHNARNEAAVSPASATRQSSLKVTISLTPKWNEIAGTTNLPDGTQLQASLQPPLSTCSPNCGFVWEGDATVANGRFTLGPLHLAAGKYFLKITTPLAELEPDGVRAVIGAHGENLTGPFVAAPLGLGLGATVNLAADVTMVGPQTAAATLKVAPEPADAKNESLIWHRSPGEAYEPTTYCRWNRTGLPPAQQTICAQLDARNAKELAALRPEDLDDASREFMGEMTASAETLRSANAAAICGLRSQDWLGTFQTNIAAYTLSEQSRLRTLARDPWSFDHFAALIRERADKDSRPNFPTRGQCLALMNSQEMDRLDQMQSRITGGYH